MPVRHWVLIWVLASFSIQSTLGWCADGPAHAPPSQVPASGSVEKFIEIQKLGELAQSPDWTLIIAGIAMALWGGQKVVGVIGDFVSTAAPAAARVWQFNSALVLGKKVGGELDRLANDLKPLALSAKTAADEYVAHINAIPEKVPHRRSIHGQSPDDVAILLLSPEMRLAISANARGREWLRQYDAKKANFEKERDALIARFVSGIDGLKTFSNQVNTLGSGLLRSEEMVHRPLVYDLAPAPYGRPGTMTMTLDGFPAEVPDPRAVPQMLAHAIARCGDLMAKLGMAKNRNVVRMQLDMLIKPAAYLGVVGIGIGLYSWGAKRLKARTNSQPEQLIEQAKQKAKQDAVREVIRSTELVALADQLKEARLNGKDADVKEIYRVLREGLRKRLPEMAQTIRQHSDPVLRDKADFENNLWKFMRDDAMADALIDSALAEAGSLELKAGTSEGVFAPIYSTDPTSAPQVNRLLIRNYGSTLKYLWPKLALDPTTIGVDAAQLAELVTETAPQMKDIAEKRRRRLEPPPPADPKPAAGAGMTGATGSSSQKSGPTVDLASAGSTDSGVALPTLGVPPEKPPK